MSNVSEKSDKKFFNKLLEKIKTNKKFQFFLITICLLIALVFIFKDVFFQNKNEIDDSVNSYVSNLETRLSQTLSKVDGAGKVSVVITVESGMETVLATKITVTENSYGKETVETPITVNGKTVVVKEMYPKIIGVLIVAEGANKISVMTKIQQAAVSLLDININQIEILAM